MRDSEVSENLVGRKGALGHDATGWAFGIPESVFGLNRWAQPSGALGQRGAQILG